MKRKYAESNSPRHGSPQGVGGRTISRRIPQSGRFLSTRALLNRAARALQEGNSGGAGVDWTVNTIDFNAGMSDECVGTISFGLDSIRRAS